MLETLPPWEALTFFQKGALFIIACVVGYAAFSLFSLTWRIPNLILAKKELAEAQTRYYELLAIAREKPEDKP